MTDDEARTRAIDGPFTVGEFMQRPTDDEARTGSRTDVVARARWAVHGGAHNHDLLNALADEIERLRAALALIRDGSTDAHARRHAGAALAGNDG